MTKLIAQQALSIIPRPNERKWHESKIENGKRKLKKVTVRRAADDKTYCQPLPISVGRLCQDITLLQVCPSRNPLPANLIFASFS